MPTAPARRRPSSTFPEPVPGVIEYSPGDRYAVLGTSGTGKTVYVTILACTLVPFRAEESDWQCWWLDTKDDPDDLEMLGDWGFQEGLRRGTSARRVVHLRGSKEDVYNQAQDISQAALRRHGILLVYDEYNHVVKNRIDAGPEVEDVHKRGRGLDVGSIGGVQEPVNVPRFLFSQAIHKAIFGLEHLPDIKLAREMNPEYAAGWPDKTAVTTPDVHGFWARSGPQGGSDNAWHYHANVKRWHDTLGLAA